MQNCQVLQCVLPEKDLDTQSGNECERLKKHHFSRVDAFNKLISAVISEWFDDFMARDEKFEDDDMDAMISHFSRMTGFHVKSFMKKQK